MINMNLSFKVGNYWYDVKIHLTHYERSTIMPIADNILKKISEDPSEILSQKLYRAIREAILNGEFVSDMRLPSTRNLALDLNFSRNTVVAAYEQLTFEGYIYSLVGKGAFVIPNLCIPTSSSSSNNKEVTLSKRGKKLLNNFTKSDHTKKTGAFIPHVPDIKSFPYVRFNQIVSKIRREALIEDLSYSNSAGSIKLKEAISNQVRVARSITCKTEQVIIFGSATEAINTINIILCDVGDLVYTESPSYWGFQKQLQSNGLEIKEIPVDAAGINLQDVKGKSPKLILVTPSHQYPLGSIMSLKRRKELLGFARKNESWIIEDDYDSEFRYAGHPIPSLYGLEDNPPVIYLGTFSKTIYPALRLCYLIIPENLINPFKSAHNLLSRGSDLLMQNALAEFIEQGHYATHIKNMRQIYSKRRKRLIELITQHLGNDFIELSSSYDAGLHLILKLPLTIDDKKIAKELEEKNIIVSPLSRYYLNTPEQHGLLLGFASVSEDEMNEAFLIMATIIKNHIQLSSK